MKRYLKFLLVAAAGAPCAIGVTAVAAATPDDVGACRLVADAAARLACYDAIALPPSAAPRISTAAPPAAVVVGGSPAKSVAPAPPPAIPEPAIPVPPSQSTNTPRVAGSFGAEVLPAPKPAVGPDTMIAHVRGKIDGLRRGVDFQLDNGQVWTYIDNQAYDYEGDNPTATIRRNFLGNYWMLLSGSGTEVRVRRVQ